jgi:hypothetical protein
MLVAPSCFAQEMTVRVVNAANGRPLKDQLVYIGVREPLVWNDLQLKTDANGEARFTLPDPAPPHMRVNVLLSPLRWDCGCMFVAATEGVIQKGVVPPPGAKPTKAAASLKPSPGQIQFAVRPLSFSDRVYMFFIGQ